MITLLREKNGGLYHLEGDNLAFCQLIQDLNLVDLDTNNGIYTCNNRRGGQNQIASRLDRYLLSKNLMQERWNIENTILPAAGSDHWPNSIKLDIQTDLNAKPFRFEKFWLTHPDFATNIQAWWEEMPNIEGTTMYRF